MPETPAHNPIVVSPSSDPSLAVRRRRTPMDTVAFLPPLVSRISHCRLDRAVCRRWLVVQGMVAAGLLGAQPGRKARSTTCWGVATFCC